MSQGEPLDASRMTIPIPSQRTILLAEPDPITAGWLRTAFEKLGYRVTHVVSGLEALNTITTGAIDLVLLNARTPGLNAHDVLWDLRNNLGLHTLPVVVLFPRHDDAHELVELWRWANLCLQRPVSDRFIVAVVQRFLNGTDGSVELSNNGNGASHEGT